MERRRSAAAIVTTDRGDRMRARFVVLRTGPLSVPKLPGIPGIGSFRGHSFHTSRWDYGYTGGDSDGAPMANKLGDKRVGVIGTGATAVQCVPHLARYCRGIPCTSSSARRPRSTCAGIRPTDPEWVKTLTAGLAAAPDATTSTGWCRAGLAEVDLVSDGWTDVIRNLGAILPRGERISQRRRRHIDGRDRAAWRSSRTSKR